MTAAAWIALLAAVALVVVMLRISSCGTRPGLAEAFGGDDDQVVVEDNMHEMPRARRERIAKNARRM